MSNDEHNGGLDIELDIPPAYIEGPGGGPAMPTGPGVSDEDKEAAGEMAIGLNYVAAASATAAAIYAAVGLAPAAAAYGVASGVAWFLGTMMSDIADDPPKPYNRVVRFKRRECSPPGMSDPILAKVGVMTQSSLFAVVTAQGFLAAVERRDGAQVAGDIDWALAHDAVDHKARETLVRDIAVMAAATLAVARAIDDTEYDIEVPAGSANAVRQWIQTPGVVQQMREHLGRAGLTTLETRAALRWLQSGPELPGSDVRLSTGLEESAQRLYDLASRMYDLHQ